MDEEVYILPSYVIDTIPLLIVAFKVVNSVKFNSTIVAFITMVSLLSCVTDNTLILSALIPVAFAILDSISL